MKTCCEPCSRNCMLMIFVGTEDPITDENKANYKRLNKLTQKQVLLTACKTRKIFKCAWSLVNFPSV